MGDIPPTWARDVTRAILELFDTRRRALPWRDTRDPYRIWVSEVMLQQTRVETVIPYYERWLDRFPTLAHLADAPEDDVLHAWAGLGYYSRARNLHRAAGVVRETLNGAVPQTAEALRSLPGVGSYTAGAIASIAFGEPAPAIDGNARRVLCRLLDAELSAGALHEAGRALVPADRPGDFNQGLMELGATLCTPRSPRCGRCPVQRHCHAFAAGTQELRPARKTRAPVPGFRLVTLVAHTAHEVLLEKRAERLLRGMWCFPSAPLEGDDGLRTARAFCRSLLGVRAAPAPLGSLSHVFTHRVEHYHVVRIPLEHTHAPRRTGEWRWHPRAALHDVALPAAQRKIARIAGL